jgi:hypothetical protein
MMKNHIDVSSVLRHAVSESYSNLVTRPTGVAVRVYIEAQIQAARDCEVTVIDFSQVGMMDFSCADEIVAKLVMQHEKGTPTRSMWCSSVTGCPSYRMKLTPIHTSLSHTDEVFRLASKTGHQGFPA